MNRLVDPIVQARYNFAYFLVVLSMIEASKFMNLLFLFADLLVFTLYNLEFCQQVQKYWN